MELELRTMYFVLYARDFSQVFKGFLNLWNKQKHKDHEQWKTEY